MFTVAEAALLLPPITKAEMMPSTVRVFPVPGGPCRRGGIAGQAKTKDVLDERSPAWAKTYTHLEKHHVASSAHFHGACSSAAAMTEVTSGGDGVKLGRVVLFTQFGPRARC